MESIIRKKWTLILSICILLFITYKVKEEFYPTLVTWYGLDNEWAITYAAPYDEVEERYAGDIYGDIKGKKVTKVVLKADDRIVADYLFDEKDQEIPLYFYPIDQNKGRISGRSENVILSIYYIENGVDHMDNVRLYSEKGMVQKIE